MKTLFLVSLVAALASCTTNQPLNDKLVDVTLDLLTLGLTQNAPEPLPAITVSK